MYTITKCMAIFLSRLLHFPVHISGSKIGVSSNKLIYKTETDSQTLKTNLWLPKAGGRDKLGIFGLADTNYYIYLNHFAIYRKLIQHCKLTTLWLKKIKSIFKFSNYNSPSVLGMTGKRMLATDNIPALTLMKYFIYK